MRRYWRVWAYLRPYRTAFALALATSVLTSVLDGFTFALLIPFLRVLFDVGSAVAEVPTIVERVLAATIGPFVPEGDQATVLRGLIVIILVTVALKNVMDFVASYLSRYIEEAVTRDLRAELHQHLQRLSLAYVQRTKAGQLMSRMLSDVQHARLLVNSGLQAFIRNGVLILVYLAILFGLSWRLGLITLLLAPAIALVMRPLLSRVRTLSVSAMERRGELAAMMSESLSGARLIKAHAAEPYERGRFLDTLNRYFTTVMRTQGVSLLSSPVSETLGAGVFVLLLYAGAWMATSGAGLRPELYIAFLAVTLRLLPPVKRIAQVPTYAEQAYAGLARVFEVLDEPADDVDGPDDATFPGLRDAIEFRDVSFRYAQGPLVLERLSFTVRKGEVVALVGYSGAGKSTLVDLLPRFIDPTEGAVLLDGRPTTDFSRRSLRESMAVVSQETVIFNDTVLANIAYGKDPDSCREAVVEAARMANADQFIARLPQGYDTRLGERGTHLSGGERQRIALARALLVDPPILILDEATSALDNESEQLVQVALERAMAGRTVLVIAHRLSTVSTADMIFVLDDGHIVESGDHGTLMSAGGLYRRLHDMASRRSGRRRRERRQHAEPVEADRREAPRRSGGDRRQR